MPGRLLLPAAAPSSSDGQQLDIVGPATTAATAAATAATTTAALAATVVGRWFPMRTLILVPAAIGCSSPCSVHRVLFRLPVLLPHRKLDVLTRQRTLLAHENTTIHFIR